MKIVIYDTETNGLPEKGAKPFEYQKWPHIVQLSFLVYEKPDDYILPFATLMPVYMADYIIKPIGFTISEEVSKIHGITQSYAIKHGVNLIDALTDLLKHIEDADVIVAHNAAFDKNTIHSELFRMGAFEGKMRNTWECKSTVREFCTMLSAVSLCRCEFPRQDIKPYPFDNRTKWPRLEELFRKLFPFEVIPSGFHNSLIDIKITAKCFFGLLDMGHLSISEQQHSLPEYISFP